MVVVENPSRTEDQTSPSGTKTMPYSLKSPSFPIHMLGLNFILTTFAYIDVLTCCQVIDWFDICINAEPNKYP